MLNLKVLTSAVISTALCFNLAYAPVLAAKDSYIENLDPTMNPGTLNIEDYYADYTSMTFRSMDGGTTTLSLSGSSISVDTDCATGIRINVMNDRRAIVATGAGDSSFSFDADEDLAVNGLYYMQFLFTAGGYQTNYDSIALTRKTDGNLAFVESTCYDFNVERCSELLTDDQSLQECLAPQNDSESTDPQVIALAQEITGRCNTDFDKVAAIYEYIIENFAYDYVQVSDSSYIYQDNAYYLIRRKIAICEGLGNTFTALCRAAGVPAAVSFGIGGDASEFVLADDFVGDEGCNHAWAVVCIDGVWYHVDPTWDCANSFTGDSIETGDWSDGTATHDWFLLPLEYFSNTHKICDADTIHSRPETGSCGDHATYEITRDGTITISGSGTLELPYGCNGFRYVVFSDDCTIDTIGDSCFADCDVLESVVLPETVTRIEDYAFNTCEDLEYIYLPEGLEYIGYCAFDYCDELSYVYIPDSVTTIDEWAFDDCPRAIISIPAGMDLAEEEYYVSPYRIIERR